MSEVDRATPSPRDSARYPAARGIGSSVRAHASAIQRIASSRSSRAGNYLLQLQRSYGNGYVQKVLSTASQAGASQVERIPAARLELPSKTSVLKQLSRATSASRPLQPKLTISDPDDPYEKEAEEIAEKVVVQRKCASGGDSDEECGQCRMNRLSLRRVCTDETAGSEAPGIVDDHTIQQTGEMRRTVQRLSWDDVANVVSSAEDTVKQDAEAAASAVASGAQAVGQTVESGAQAVAGAVETGAQAVAQGVEAAGQAVVSGAEAVASGAVAAGKAVVSGVEAAGQAVVGGTEDILTAMGGANAIAGLFGGTVTVTPSGGVVISIPDQEIAEVEDETFVLPVGIPTLTLFDAGFKLGPFVIDAWAGTIVGDPSVTLAIGPVRLQNISLVLDPVGGTYLGTAQLYIGSAISGSVEKADEAKLQAEGVIPAEPPIPILASAELGLRAILRLVGKEGFSDTVNVGYAGGSFILRQVFDVKLGALANLDHEAFLRIEIEGEEICSVIWPIKSQRLGDAGVEIRVPVTIATGSGKAVAIGTPTAAKFPADAIETELQDDHEPEHCMGLEELGKFLCRKGKLPPDICLVLFPAKPSTPPGPPPPVPFGPVAPPVTPPSVASAPTGRTPSDPIEMQWYKPDNLYDTPIELDGQKYRRTKPGQPLPLPDSNLEIGVESQYLAKVGKLLILAFEPDGGAKRRFNEKLKAHGYGGTKGAGTDADHNQDLQWAGPDEFYNLWPFDSSANRSAGPLQNDLQEITFSDRAGDPPQTMSIGEFKRRGLHRDHKYFTIKCISLTPRACP
ncbi:hypothetical protein FAZ95_11805 [Trinickia violacea]|uniref:Uncharacterized protein n=1 Tax=Trinickia violacea TaxID=2571746 RepID=A0A4P8IPB7_9BURK|nr:hypothetical protein [Trinickia violacea]QCP49797.1 hypothetical protein FAZ95_11805 [Trinickia violacea]